MIRIVIAEDEPLIAKGIQAILANYPLYHVVGTALNGNEALEMVRTLHPDILLTDIEMPKMTGIQLVAELRKNGPKTEVIFLTAFRDFRYAKSALELGVNNYLVKPIDERELLESLEKTDVKLANDSVTQETIIRDRLNRYLQSGELVSLRPIQWNRQKSNWCLFYLLGESESNHSVTPVEYWRNYFRAFRKGVSFAESQENCFFLLEGFPDTDWQEECLQLKRLQPTWQILNSSSFEKLTEVYGALGRLQQKRRDVFFAETFFPASQPNDYRKLFHELEQWIESAETPQRIRETILQLTNLIAANFHQDITAFYQNFSERMLRLLTLLKAHFPSEENYLPTALLHHWLIQPNYNKLISLMDYDLKNKILVTTRLAQDELPKDVYLLMDYIRKNFRKDISLTELAELVNMNRTYVSTYFKRHTGESFKSFQTNLRIAEAKRLLTETDKRVFVIADEIGYIGTHHFNSVFSHHTGVSPTQYRNQISEENDVQK